LFEDYAKRPARDERRLTRLMGVLLFIVLSFMLYRIIVNFSL